MTLPLDQHRCIQCGTCCRGPITVGEADLLRWAAQARHDILFHLLREEMIIEPLVRNERQTCRWLVWLPGQGTFACAIYDTRPGVCASFPLTVEGATRAGCRGLNPLPYVPGTCIT